MRHERFGIPFMNLELEIKTKRDIIKTEPSPIFKT
jgi:hypothetical protein